jgi:GNAT superfamily N-acetyltransferase
MERTNSRPTQVTVEILQCSSLGSPGVEKATIKALGRLWPLFNGERIEGKALLHRLSSSTRTLFLAHDMYGKAQGFALGSVESTPLRDSPFFEVWALFVAEGFRGLGFGKALITSVHQYAAAIHCTDIHVSSEPEAAAFYQALGFSPYAKRLRIGLKHHDDAHFLDNSK